MVRTSEPILTWKPSGQFAKGVGVRLKLTQKLSRLRRPLNDALDGLALAFVQLAIHIRSQESADVVRKHRKVRKIPRYSSCSRSNNSRSSMRAR